MSEAVSDTPSPPDPDVVPDLYAHALVMQHAWQELVRLMLERRLIDDNDLAILLRRLDQAADATAQRGREETGDEMAGVVLKIERSLPARRRALI